MKCRTIGSSALALLAGLTLTVTIPAAKADPTTGWLRAGGTYDYNDTNNWVGGVINGVWDTSLVVTQTETAQFDVDTVLSNGLSFWYDTPGTAYSVTLWSGTHQVITLGGDIVVNTVKNVGVNVGYASTAHILDVNLGGANRTFTTKSGGSLIFLNTVSNGSFTVAGAGTVAFKGGYCTAATVDATVLPGTTLKFDSSTTSVTGTNRVRNVTLRSCTLYDVGNASTDTVDTLNGAMIADVLVPGGGDIVTISAGAGRNSQLVADSLIRTNYATILFRGPSLGSTPGGDVANVFFATAPTAQLVGGGGAAGTKNISILPWALGGTNATDGGSAFVTYVTSNGIRPLNATNECDNTITDGAISDHNVCLLPGTALTLNSPCTVNSLIMNASPSSANVSVNGSGALTVTSGAVYGQVGSSQTTINKPLDFGAREGLIGTPSGKFLTVNSIAGSGGLTLYSPGTPSATAGIGVRLTNSCTYTGATTIIGAATPYVSTVFPSGGRAGDVSVRGVIWLNNTSPTFNGLSGDGTVAQSGSANVSLAVGDNNATSAFDGVFKETSSGRLAVNKIGSGTLTLNGANLHTGPTAVSNGTLVVNGSMVSPVTVCTNATLGGVGVIATNTTALTVNNGGLVAPGAPGGGIGTLTVTGNVSFAAGGQLALDASGTNADLLAVSGTVSGAATVPVNITASGKGPWKVMTASAITATFTSSTAGFSLAPNVSNTELWLARTAGGSLITIR